MHLLSPVLQFAAQCIAYPEKESRLGSWNKLLMSLCYHLVRFTS